MLIWYHYILLFIFSSHVVFSQIIFEHGKIECSYPLPRRLKESHHNFFNFTANHEASLLVFESNDLVFNNTNIFDGGTIELCLEDDDDCEYGTFDIQYKEGISTKLRKDLNAMIFQKHLNAGDKTSYELLTNGRYCIYYHDYTNENNTDYLSQVAQGDILQTLEMTFNCTFRGLYIELQGLLIADITALIFELVLIVVLKRKLGKSGFDSDSINHIPFKFMINLLSLEIIKNSVEISLSGYIYFTDLEYSGAKFSRYNEILKSIDILKVIIDYFKTFTLYHFIALNKAVLVPSNWEIKEILSYHRFFLMLSILKTIIELIANIHGIPDTDDYDLLDILKSEVFNLGVSIIMCVLYYYKSQSVERSLDNSFKLYSHCFRYSRIFILPSLIAYSTLMWCFSVVLLELIISGLIHIIIEESCDMPRSIFQNINFFALYFLELILTTSQSYYRLTLPLMITLMSYIWRGVLVSEIESKKINHSTT